MKNKTLFLISVVFLIFCFVVLFNGLKKDNTYIPSKVLENKIPFFKTKTLFSEENISSDQIFIDSEFYVLNIWSSWCVPCKKEHSKLIELSKNKRLKLIGINYKDKIDNAKDFIYKMGNPFSVIITDNNGTISIELGAYGVPETFIIDKNRNIIKKIIGPLNRVSLEEIKRIIE